MVFLQTLGSVDMPGKGERKMPSPRSYIAIIVLFGTLHLVADAGMARGASIAGWAAVLIGLVKGPFGNLLTGFINAIAPGASPLQPLTPDTSGGTPYQPIAPYPAPGGNPP